MREQVIITTDLGYGDAGKGSIVDSIVHEYDIGLVVRYSGGAQAAHNVVTPDGQHHTFAQFGSGSFKPGTKTYLGPQMLIQPQFLLQEAKALTRLGVNSPLTLLHIDQAAPIITPYHQLVNQLKELARGAERHGSCGLGIGETRNDSEFAPDLTLRAGDLCNESLFIERLESIREAKREQMLELLSAHARNEEIVATWHRFDDENLFLETVRSYQELYQKAAIVDHGFLKQHLQSGKRAVFEAAQGTLLDEDYGFFPYVTRGKVSDVHAHELLEAIDYQGDRFVLGITRAYAARHGPGPFPTENLWLRSQISEEHNGNGKWQGAFRMGHFDAVATRYAMAVNKRVDGLAITSLDQLPQQNEFLFAKAYTDATYSNEWLFQMQPAEPGNLEELAKRSEYLMREVTPVYTKVATTGTSIPNIIAAACGKEVVMTSSGTTRESKQFLATAAQLAA